MIKWLELGYEIWMKLIANEHFFKLMMKILVNFRQNFLSIKGKF